MLWLEDTAVDRHHIHVISDTATFLMPIYLCIFLYWYKYPLTFGRNYGVWSVTWSVKCLEKSVLNRARGTDLHSVKQLLMLLASVHPNSEAQGCKRKALHSEAKFSQQCKKVILLWKILLHILPDRKGILSWKFNCSTLKLRPLVQREVSMVTKGRY